ncbi:MAG: anthranilate phosphoribosyltransferase [Sandaracinaceae bacterium]|nr:anthranilate phosphoribosyltransferase [Sandaracinaceae bacterium]
MSELADALARVVAGEVLDAPAMEAAMARILAGEASPVHVAALAVALRMRGETPGELAAAARALRRAAVALPGPARRPLLDTCGTGGDGAGTFNISTAGALVVAACGVRVAKHGNRAVSSRSGSADVLEALGVALDEGPEASAACLDELGIAFLFAPAFHGALRYAAPVRRELGLRTFFNLLGPLANPAGATHQLLGLYDPARLGAIAEVLGALGVERAWVVHGEGGLDEVSPAGPTRVAVLDAGEVTERVVEPADFGLAPVALEGLAGGDAGANAAIVRAVLDGATGAPRAAVVINAAAALVVAGVETDLRAAAERAAAAIDRADARALLDRWVARRAP